MKKTKKPRGVSIKSLVSKPAFPRHLEILIKSKLTDIDDIEFLHQLFKAYTDLAQQGAKYSDSQREKSQKPRSSFETDNERLNKKTLIQRALKDAGEGANTHSVMQHLSGILEREGMHPNLEIAKNKSLLTTTDTNGKQVKFTYSNVQKILSQIRTLSAPRGRPQIKQK